MTREKQSKCAREMMTLMGVLEMLYKYQNPFIAFFFLIWSKIIPALHLALFPTMVHSCTDLINSSSNMSIICNFSLFLCFLSTHSNKAFLHFMNRF